MKLQVLKSENFELKTWSGGTTTELFIYPPTSEFGRRNFNFRISTATVEVEQSTFTALPNVNRTLMVLDGVMTLDHQNKHTTRLKKFDFDYFEGGWKTVSNGMCTDFNLMTMGKTSGKLEAIVIGRDQEKAYTLDHKMGWVFLYVAQGGVTIRTNSTIHELAMGELLTIDNPDNSNMQISSTYETELVVVRISD